MEISEPETKGDKMVMASDACYKEETSELTELAAVVEQVTISISLSLFYKTCRYVVNITHMKNSHYN